MSLDDGEAVYYKSPDESWVLGYKKGNTVVSESKNKEWKLKSKVDDNELYVIMDPEGIDEDTDDLLKMGELHEGALLRCVRRRHANDEIYTFIGGSVVLSLNPWKFTIPSYTADRIPFYASGGRDPPHIWCIGKTAYENMILTKTNQTVLVSGESGAGKTEAVKSLLKFLGALSSFRAGSPDNEEGQKGLLLQKQIEACNPILETFGNAKTVRNDNSSRFGKFLKVIYNANGVVCGAHTINYLLERSRVVKVASQERLFHSFYQLLSTKKARSKYNLDEGKLYEVCGDSIKIDGVDDAEGFAETNEALEIIGITGDQRDSVWGVVAGILHLQRIVFSKNEETDATQISPNTRKYLSLAADCWSVDADSLEQEFLTVKVKAGNETVTRKHSVLKAQSCRDAICKETYASLFQWLIDKINETMKPTSEEASFIGLLDIFGFEHFKINSLEQLCINLANEMLQNHYNEHIFTADIAECKAEGIETQHVEYQDNTEIVSLIADTKNGVLAHLDDQCKTRPEDDAAFLERVTTQYASKENIFRRTKLDRDCFRISHYAAEVAYAVEGFGEKNLDSVQQGLLDLLQASSSPLVAEVMISDSRSQDSVTSIFKKQLKSLLTVIESTTPAWIRCIKPHPVKKPGLFDPITTMAQLASSGVLETVRVRKLGYPVRLPHALFAERFRILLPRGFDASKADPEECALAILKNLNLEKEKAQIGKTKVFLRSFAHTHVEDARVAAFDNFANTIRSFSLTALAMQDAFGRKHHELVALLKQQRIEREEFISSFDDSAASLTEEESSERHMTYISEGEGKLICLSSQFDRIVEDLHEEQLQTRNAIIQLRDDEEKYRVDMEYDRSLPTLHLDEEQEFEYITTVQWPQQMSFFNDLVATENDLLNQFHQSEVTALESEEDFERSVLTIEQSEESLREQLKFEERFRTEEAIQMASAGYVEVHATERMYIENEEVDLRDEISIEEEGYWEILKVAHSQSWERARTVQNWREINDLQVMEETLRTAILRDYDMDVDLLWVDHSHLKVGLFSQYMFDCEIQEASQRSAILQPYWAFWSALQHAWDSTLYVALLLELQSNHLRSRDSLIGLYDESMVMLETLEAREGSTAAALARDRELGRVYENLKKMEKQLSHQLPPPSFAAVEYGHGRELQHHQGSHPASPQRSYERSVSPANRPQRRTTSASMARSVSQSQSLTPQTTVPDPFSQGTWLWRTIAPTVQKGWKRLWVKLTQDGQLIFRSSPSSESRVLKLSNVTSVETHELPDRDGYKPPNEKMPSVAKRYSSSCKYSAIKLGLKADVEGSVVPRKKSMILCAEFPAVAVIWLRKLRREWLKVCDEEYKQPTFESMSPMREPEEPEPVPRGLIDISKLLEAAEGDNHAANLLRDLRKWMKKTKQSGYDIAADINFRASSMPPQSPEREQSAGVSSPLPRQGLSAPSPHFREVEDADNFSDLSDNVDCPKCAAGEGVTFTNPTEPYESGQSTVAEWIDEYRKQPQPFTRDHFAECMRTGGPIRTLCAAVTSYGTDSCHRVMDNMIKRTLLGYGDSVVSQKEFIVWCSAGSEEPAPLYYHRVGLMAVDSICTAAVIIAAAATPPPEQMAAPPIGSPQAEVSSGVGVRTPLSIVRESEAGSPPPAIASPQQHHSPPPPVINQQQQQQQPPQQQLSPPCSQQSPEAVSHQPPPQTQPPVESPAKSAPPPARDTEKASPPPAAAPVPAPVAAPAPVPSVAPVAVAEPVVSTPPQVEPKAADTKPPAVTVTEEVEPLEPGTDWACEFCEHTNAADAPICEVCDTQSPHKATSQAFPQ